jgi:hypothetical protein
MVEMIFEQDVWQLFAHQAEYISLHKELQVHIASVTLLIFKHVLLYNKLRCS